VIERLTGRRALLVAGIAGVLAVALVLALRLGGTTEEQGPPTGAARLVPAGALAYLHVSTDTDREATRRALDVVARFPGLRAMRDGALTRLQALRPGFSVRRDLEPWMGEEAAVALLDTGGPAAGTLLVVEVRDSRRAQAFLARAGARPAGAYRGTALSSLGALSAAFVGSHLVVGQAPGVRFAVDAHGGRARALAADPVFRRATGDLPARRAADLYLPAAGVTRLLRERAGLAGAAGSLLDQAGLRGVSLALSARDRGVEVLVHSVHDRRARGDAARPFVPALVSAVPRDAMAYIGLTGLDRALARVLRDGLAGERAARLVGRARLELSRRAGVDLRADVLPLFQGEVAVWLAPAQPSPILTLVAATRNEATTREAFAQLQAPLARLFAPPNAGPGQAPVFEQRTVDGVEAFLLRLAPGVELDYAVFDGKLVVSTALDGIRKVKRSGGSIAADGSFAAALGDRPDRVTSLVFLDLSQLLGLAERTGLTESPAYQRLRDDLRQVRAIGIAASDGETDSTTELFLQTT